MSHTTPITTNQEINLAYVIRLSWDQGGGEWRILLKPVQGQEARLFCDVESMLFYLETVMRNEQRKA
jgi:hypothetical protein